MDRSAISPPWNDLKPAGRMLRPAEVAERVGLSKSQIYEMISEGRFPPFIKLSQRASGMPEVWVDAFVQSRVESHEGQGEAK